MKFKDVAIGVTVGGFVVAILSFFIPLHVASSACRPRFLELIFQHHFSYFQGLLIAGLSGFRIGQRLTGPEQALKRNFRRMTRTIEMSNVLVG